MTTEQLKEQEIRPSQLMPAETIKLEAKKCRFCGEIFAPSDVKRQIVEFRLGISRENETKKCPSCAELIKLDARKCEFCNEVFDPIEVERQIEARRSELWDNFRKSKGLKQCPTFSNLDDMHENGIHDYLKFIKLGYGRGSDHACKDIRAGSMTRDQGIEMVRKYDHVKPRRDLERWLKYVNMTEEEFDHVCDTFRDRRVWRIQDGQWVKDNIWGEPSA